MATVSALQYSPNALDKHTPAWVRLPVVILPASSPLREVATSVLLPAGVRVLPPEQSADAELCVVDLTVPAGLAAAQALPPGLALIGIVEGEPPHGLMLADMLSPARCAAELLFRVRRAATHRAKEREVTGRERELSLLLSLTGKYAETLNAEALLHDVTRSLADELQIIRASFVMVEEERQHGFIIAASDDAGLKDLRIELARYPEIREVVRTRKPVLIEDAPSHPLLEGVQSEVAAKGIHSIAALPLAVGGKVLGVLLVRASSMRGPFSHREIDFLATVAHATAVALRNARLLESVRGQTEREKSARIAAEEHAQNLKRYEKYFARDSEGIAILDGRAWVLALNPSAASLLDVSPETAVGRHIHALTNPLDEGVILEMLAAVARGEQRRNVDVAVRTNSGRPLTLSVSASQLQDSGEAAILSFRDVTEERWMADELRSTKEFLERLIDSSVDAIIAADMNGKIILFNKGAEAIAGYSRVEALKVLDVRQLYPAGKAAEVMARLRRSDVDGKGRLSLTRQEILHKNGERVPVNMTASIIYEGEREVATVGIFTDLRDRVQLERKLSDVETRLEESEKNAVIVALAGTAAHELNQPLTSVMGYAELLRRKLSETDFAYRPVDIIYREAERMAEIVRKIGKITRYETKSYIGTSKILDLDKASSHEE
jgi:PAS domain S-box-containing protein